MEILFELGEFIGSIVEVAFTLLFCNILSVVEWCLPAATSSGLAIEILFALFGVIAEATSIFIILFFRRVILGSLFGIVFIPFLDSFDHRLLKQLVLSQAHYWLLRLPERWKRPASVINIIVHLSVALYI